MGPGTWDGWLLLQLADSTFPTGGFVHSGGLEAAAQAGAVRDGEDLARWIALALDQCGHALLPFAAAAHDAPEDVAALDQRCDATLSNHVANRASRAQGGAWLVATAAAFPVSPVPALCAALRVEGQPCHLAPCFGAGVRALGVARDEASRLFLFLQLRGAVSTAIRLGLIGPLAAQALQARAATEAEAVLARCGDLGVADAAQTAPLLDVWHGQHDRLYSRLFST